MSSHSLSVEREIHCQILISIETASDEESIILAPPTSLSVSEGTDTLVPCVSTSSLPSFTRRSPAETGGSPSLFGLMVPAVGREEGGEITCEVGGDSADVTLTVIGEWDDVIVL